MTGDAIFLVETKVGKLKNRAAGCLFTIMCDVCEELTETALHITKTSTVI